MFCNVTHMDQLWQTKWNCRPRKYKVTSWSCMQTDTLAPKYVPRVCRGSSTACLVGTRAPAGDEDSASLSATSLVQDVRQVCISLTSQVTQAQKGNSYTNSLTKCRSSLTEINRSVYFLLWEFYTSKEPQNIFSKTALHPQRLITFRHTQQRLFCTCWAPHKNYHDPFSKTQWFPSLSSAGLRRCSSRHATTGWSG